MKRTLLGILCTGSIGILLFTLVLSNKVYPTNGGITLYGKVLSETIDTHIFNVLIVKVT